MTDFTANINNNPQNKTVDDILSEGDEIYNKWKTEAKVIFKKYNVSMKSYMETKDSMLSENEDLNSMPQFMKIIYSELDKIFDRLQKEHKDFAMTYPVPLRYMCQLGQYSSKAFHLYLKKIEQKPWTTEEEYIDYQAQYVKILFMQLNRKWTVKELQNIYLNAKKTLTEERTEFKKLIDKCQKEVEAEEAHADKKRLEDLQKILIEKLKAKSGIN